MAEKLDSGVARLNSLLTLRVLATLAVVFGHSASFYGAFPWSQYPPNPYWQSQAVTVFFLVSGYTIAWVCDRDAAKGGSIGSFVFDRLTRLLIPLVPVLTIVAVVEWLIFPTHPYAENFDVRTFVGNIALLQNIEFRLPLTGSITALGIESFGTNRPLWTISIEFWIYLAFAGTFFAVTARRLSLAIISMSIGIAGWLAIQEHVTGGRGAGLALFWMIGALIYFGLKQAPLPSRRAVLVAAPVATLFVAHLFSPANWPAGGTYSMLYNFLLAFLFFACVAVAPQVPRFCVRGVTFLGSFAYTAYLIHYPVIYWLHHHQLLPAGAPGAILSGTAGMIVAYLLSLPFEQNYKSIREQLRTWIAVVRGSSRVQIASD